MSATIYTCEARFSIYDAVNMRWGPWTSAKNLLELSITKPDPTTIKDISTRPDEGFGNTLQSRQFSGGSPELTVRTRDVVNTNVVPEEMVLLAAALAAQVSTYSKPAATDHYFTGYVDAFGMSIETNESNLDGTSMVLHAQTAVTGGAMSGNVASATTTTMVVTGAGWTADALIGQKVMITEGTGAGQIVAITDNDATSVTVASWTTQPDNTSRYAIVKPTALTKNTDYALSDEDLKYGTVTPLSGGSLALGNIVHGFVDTFAVTGTKFLGAAQDSVKFRVRGKAKELETGREGMLIIHRCSSGSAEAQQFVADAESPAYKELSLTGELEVPDGESSPYTFLDGLTYATTA